MKKAKTRKELRINAKFEVMDEKQECEFKTLLADILADYVLAKRKQKHKKSNLPESR